MKCTVQSTDCRKDVIFGKSDLIPNGTYENFGWTWIGCAYVMLLPKSCLGIRNQHMVSLGPCEIPFFFITE